MKGYIKVELILKVDSGCLEDCIQLIENFVLWEIDEVKIHKDIEIVEKCIDATKFTKGIEEGFEELFF